MKEPFEWDDYSDQPAQLKDKTYKKTMRKRQLISLLKTILTALVVLPISLVLMPFVKRKEIVSKDFFCIGIDFQREPKETLQLINDLGVQRVLLRFKLWEMQSLDMLKEYLLLLKSKKVTLKILQDRENIEDLALLKNNLNNLFSELNGLVNIYEIGTTINRAKWGFFSVDEYNRFFERAYKLKTKEFPHIKLIGSGVIDFEYHFTAHTLFNFFSYHYDGVSALLYVDRRGSPFNTQAGFDLCKKIELLWTMVKLSPKSADVIYVTETNWPIKATAPYSPTSEKECVSLEDYADFMVAYHLIALASRKVERVYWHQLVAHGYGLYSQVENRKYPAFLAYKVMVKLLKDKRLLDFDMKSRIKWFRFEGLEVFYCEDGFEKSFVKSGDRDIFGKSFKKGRVIYR